MILAFQLNQALDDVPNSKIKAFSTRSRRRLVVESKQAQLRIKLRSRLKPATRPTRNLKFIRASPKAKQFEYIPLRDNAIVDPYCMLTMIL